MLLAEGVPLAVSTIDCVPVFTPAALLTDDGVCVDWIAAAFGLYLTVAGVNAVVSAGMGVVAVLVGLDVEVVPAAGGKSAAPDETVLAGVLLDVVIAFCLLDLAAWFRLADVTCTLLKDCYSMNCYCPPLSVKASPGQAAHNLLLKIGSMLMNTFCIEGELGVRFMIPAVR